jgi:DNA repair protein SbcD/Mre11
MARFLHIADIHLGFDRYDCRERTRDFYHALENVLERYAIDEAVDFVVIAGDLFEHRNIQPATLNQAQLCLQMLREAQIPVLAIEGNHDNRPYGTSTSWLRYLAEWGLLILLEPGNVAVGEPFYQPWDGQRGGYIDLDCGVRVVGSNWYGATAPKAIDQIANALQSLPKGPPSTVLMFHHGLENQIARYSGALRYSELLPLKQAGVDYLALGHIHKQYAYEGWVFNPGSLEANSVEESMFDRGAYLVEIGANGINAELKTDYTQRPIVRLKLQTRGSELLEELEERAIAEVQQAVASELIPTDKQPIVELRIEGMVGFNRLDLDTRKLQAQLQDISNALIFLLKYNVDVAAYESPLAEDAERDKIEREIFTDMLAANTVYKPRAAELAKGLVQLKDLQLEGRPEVDLFEFAHELLNPNGDTDLPISP